MGSRPSTCFTIALLLLPLVPAARLLLGRERSAWQRAGRGIAATVLPIAAIAVGLLWYNYNRFGNVFEFGQRYQLSSDTTPYAAHLSPGYVGYNFRLYFFRSWRWTGNFPFVEERPVPKEPVGHGGVEHPAGLIPMVPFVLLATAFPFALAPLAAAEKRNPSLLLSAILVVSLGNAAFLCFFFGTCVRYEMEFAPALALLAAVGTLGLEKRWASRTFAIIGLRAAWPALLAVSVGFNLLAALNLRGNYELIEGVAYVAAGKSQLAIEHLKRATRLRPADPTAHIDLGIVYLGEDQYRDACAEFSQGIEFVIGEAEVHYAYAYCLYKLGRYAEAQSELETTLAIKPDYDLAAALLEEVRADVNKGAKSATR